MSVADWLTLGGWISLLESLTAGSLAGNGGVSCCPPRNNYIKDAEQIMGGFHPQDKVSQASLFKSAVVR